MAWWRNGRALDLRSRGRGFDSRVGAQLRNDRGQVAHTRLPSASEVTKIWRYTNLYIILLLCVPKTASRIWLSAAVLSPDATGVLTLLSKPPSWPLCSVERKRMECEEKTTARVRAGDAGCQVTLCDPIWRAGSDSGAVHKLLSLPLPFLFFI